MARPKEYEENTRVHMGTRFDKEIIQAFDRLCVEHHMTRTQALECLVSNALHVGNIPPFVKGILNLPGLRPTLRGSLTNTGKRQVSTNKTA